MSVPGRTPLQTATVELIALRDRGREALTEQEYEALVAVAVLLWEQEADRLLFGEALRALRERRP